MSTWFRETPDSLRYLAEERALIEATELIADRLEERGMKRSALADRLGIGRSEITQRLNGKRNLSIKTLAAMLHELGYRIRIDAEDVSTGQRHSSRRLPIDLAPQWAPTKARYAANGSRLHVVRGNAA